LKEYAPDFSVRTILMQRVIVLPEPVLTLPTVFFAMY
jgi:hypothetical protein